MRFFRFDRPGITGLMPSLRRDLRNELLSSPLSPSNSAMPSSRLTHARPDCAVGGVARREDEDPRAAQLIDKAVNLAVAPALGYANRLFRRPPFPPPAQRCALTCVLSRAIRSGGSAGSAAASKMLCQIPCALQRLKRL